MSFFKECDECQGTGSIYVGPGSHLDEQAYDECPQCHGRGGYHEDDEELDDY
jgi:DnaJ-class molecular chaperone